MGLLMSSKLVFTSNEVGDDGAKEAIAIFLIIFLVVALARSIFMILRKRLRKSSFIVTGYALNNLSSEVRKDISEVILQYLTQKRSIEIDRDFALQSKAQKSFEELFAGDTTQVMSTTAAAAFGVKPKIRVVSSVQEQELPQETPLPTSG
jgi:hypothetical protein